MQVTRRTTLRTEGVLDDKEAVVVLRNHFESNGANAEFLCFAKAVFTCATRSMGVILI